MDDETSTPARRISSIVIIVIVVVLALSLSLLYQAYDMWTKEDPMMGYYLLIGIIGLALSSYMLLQTRRRIKRYTLKSTPITTTITCTKCEFKKVRNFERGDYILKEIPSVDARCEKCGAAMMISAIYREVEEKGKESKLFS
jgi:hypothetical protein